MILTEQLKQSERNAESLKSEAEERIQLEVEANGKQLTKHNDLANSLLESNLEHEYFIKQQSLFNCHRQLKKSVHGLDQKVETLEKESEDAKEEMVRTEESVAIRVKEAVTIAKSGERAYYSGVMAKDKVKLAVLTVKVDSSTSCQSSLIDAKVSLLCINQILYVMFMIIV